MEEDRLAQQIVGGKKQTIRGSKMPDYALWIVFFLQENSNRQGIYLFIR